MSKGRIPPNYRVSKSCGTCRHWAWDYEGAGDCDLYPNAHNPETFETIHDNSSTCICDDYQAKGA